MVEESVVISGRGFIVCYDVPSLGTGESGGGIPPRGFHSTLKKLLESGKVERLQESVLFVEDERTLSVLLDLLKRYHASALVVEGSYRLFLPER